MHAYQQPQRIPAPPALRPQHSMRPQQQQQHRQLMASLPPPSPDYAPAFRPPAPDGPFPTPAQQLQMNADPFAPPPPRPLSQPPPAIPQPPQDFRPASLQPARSNPMSNVLGSGQGLIRLLQFSGILAGESKNKLQLSWWSELVKEYFTPKATMKFTLWKDNQQQEAKPFEIGIPILPRFFLVTTQSGVKSMTLTLDGARERIYAHGHAIVECVSAVWTYKYTNGYTVTLRGPLTAHVVVTAAQPPNAQQPPTQPGYVLRIEEFEFGATHHDKSISLDAILGERMFETPILRQRLAPTPPPGSAAAQLQQQRDEQRQFEDSRVIIDRAVIPGEPVNAFGIPQATMRCLELAESVGAMAELISFADETKLGPRDALIKFANKLRATGFVLNSGQQQHDGIPPPPPPSMIPPPSSSPFQQHLHNGIPPPPIHHNTPLTLYQSAPSSITHPPHLNHPTIIPPPPSATVNSPRNTSSASNSPQKQHRSIPQNAPSSSSSGGGSNTASGSPSMSNSGTPSLSNSSLKRKQVGGDTSTGASPTMAAGEQMQQQQQQQQQGGGGASAGAGKRGSRKRNRTNTAG